MKVHVAHARHEAEGAHPLYAKGAVMNLSVDQLYARLGPAIYARCRRMLRNAAAAEDATQDIFVKIMRRAGAVPTEAALVPWVHRITTNHCLNLIRDARRHAEPTADVPEEVSYDAEETMLARDFASVVLASAPPELVEPAMMYHASGIDQSTVAERLGVSRRTVVYRIAEFTRRAMTLQAAVEAGQY